MSYQHITLPLENPENTLEKLLGEIGHQKHMANTAGTAEDSNRHESAANQVSFGILRRFRELEQRAKTAEEAFEGEKRKVLQMFDDAERAKLLLL